jgi:hypothetical protein
MKSATRNRRQNTLLFLQYLPVDSGRKSNQYSQRSWSPARQEAQLAIDRAVLMVMADGFGRYDPTQDHPP